MELVLSASEVLVHNLILNPRVFFKVISLRVRHVLLYDLQMLVEYDSLLDPSPGPRLEALLARCRVLLGDLGAFEQYQNKRSVVDGQAQVSTKHVRNIVTRELGRLEKLVSSTTPLEVRLAGISSSNLSYFEAVWSIAKQCRGLHRLNFHEPPEIIANEGALWIKVSSINERRLLMSFASEGWQESDEFDVDHNDANASRMENGREHLQDNLFGDAESRALLQAAHNLTASAKKTRIAYRHPEVRFVFTRIVQGHVRKVDALLDTLRDDGIVVRCERIAAFDLGTPTTFETMLKPRMPRLSDTLNVDCTVLLALVSDISHGTVREQSGFSDMIRRQIKDEALNPLLSSSLYSIVGGRSLICTTEAAKRMHDIVATIGTPTEKSRTEVMFGTLRSPKCAADLIKEMQQYSTHEVSPGWKLPVQIVEASYPPDKLPAIGTQMAMGEVPVAQTRIKGSSRRRSGLSPLNQSVFLHGWANNITTITSNRKVAKQIETLVFGCCPDGDIIGPDIWISPTTRSLLAKEKDRPTK